MQKAPVMKGSGLIPLEDSKLKEEVHVFGKNLEERVITESEDTPSISFNNIPNKRPTDDEDDNIESIRKRKFEAITGEEHEETIFQGDFKLFSWDLTKSNWIEKGRGYLKLNDSTVDENKKKSRLIMRVNGTLRIILNVAINRPLFRIIASTKDNIRFTDGQTVWAASGCYADQLNRMIEERIQDRQEEDLGYQEQANQDDNHHDQNREEAKDDKNIDGDNKNTKVEKREDKSVEDTNKDENIVENRKHEEHENNVDEKKPEAVADEHKKDEDEQKQDLKESKHDDSEKEVLRDQIQHEDRNENDDLKPSKKSKLDPTTS